MTELNKVEQAPARPTRPNFSYRGMNQPQIERLQFDSNFENNFSAVLLRAGLRTNLRLLVTGQGKSGEAVEGISLVSYNRFSVDIAYCESDIPGLGTAYVQIEGLGNSGAAQDLFEKLQAAGVPGGEAGCTAEPDRTFVTRHNLAGQYAAREKPAPSPPVIFKQPDQKIDLTEELHKISGVLLLGHAETNRLLKQGQSKAFYRSIRERLAERGYRRLARIVNINYLT